MRNKLTTIRLKPDISTINFEQFDKTVTSPEATEINSLTKLGNSGHLSSPLLAKTGNYRFFSVKEIPDEREPDLIIEEFPIFKKKKFPGQRNQKKNANFEKGGETFTVPLRKTG